MSLPNRSGDLLTEVLARLRDPSGAEYGEEGYGDGMYAVSIPSMLPDGADNIHPRPRKGKREKDVSLNVGFAGGSAVRSGRTTRGTRLVIVQLEVSPEYFEAQPTSWPYDVLDAVEARLEGLGGGGRAPDGRGAGISPVYDPDKDRYVADTTFRYATVH